MYEYIYIHTYTYTYTYTCKYTYTYAYTYTYTFTCTCTYTHAHTHAHRHTHTHSYSCSLYATLPDPLPTRSRNESHTDKIRDYLTGEAIAFFLFSGARLRRVCTPPCTSQGAAHHCCGAALWTPRPRMPLRGHGKVGGSGLHTHALEPKWRTTTGSSSRLLQKTNKLHTVVTHGQRPHET